MADTSKKGRVTPNDFKGIMKKISLYWPEVTEANEGRRVFRMIFIFTIFWSHIILAFILKQKIQLFQWSLRIVIKNKYDEMRISWSSRNANICLRLLIEANSLGVFLNFCSFDGCNFTHWSVYWQGWNNRYWCRHWILLHRCFITHDGIREREEIFLWRYQSNCIGRKSANWQIVASVLQINITGNDQEENGDKS